MPAKMALCLSAGASLREAQYAVEELEETARLFLLLDGRKYRGLSPDQVAELKRRFSL